MIVNDMHDRILYRYVRVYLTCDESVTGTPQVTTDGDSPVILHYVRESLSLQWNLDIELNLFRQRQGLYINGHPWDRIPWLIL